MSEESDAYYDDDDEVMDEGTRDAFLDLPFNRPFQGTKSAAFPLYMLKCMVGEEYLEDDVADTLVELLYFLATTENEPNTVAPSVLYLPTRFTKLICARHQFPAASRTYGPSLELLRHRLRTTSIKTILMLHLEVSHFSAYKYEDGRL